MCSSDLIDLFPEKSQEFWACQSHNLLENILRPKGKNEKVIYHFDVSYKIAPSFNWHTKLFWAHYLLVELFRDEGAFDNAHVHIGRAKSHASGTNTSWAALRSSMLRFGFAQRGKVRGFACEGDLPEARVLGSATDV